jgi:hypothetical protein
MYSKPMYSSLIISSMSSLSGNLSPLPQISSSNDVHSNIKQIKQCPKHPGLGSSFLQEHQILNLMEGHQTLDLLLLMLHSFLKIVKC